MRLTIGWLLKGMAMGAANVIPGVSGGTIAFITGIYERLISAVKSIDIKAIKLLFTFNLQAFSRKTDLRFLFFVFLGVAISILTLAKLLEWTFTNYEILTLAFFFGLIFASVIGVGRQIQVIDVAVTIAFVAGAAVAVGIAFLPPATGNTNMFYIILCGVVAVCSMILPGLSGAYILLLMGNYLLVLQAISSFNLRILLPLLLGCIIGLVVFSRLLSYLFKHFKDQTVGLLTGFVAGSLLIIWPWKTTRYMEVSEGRLKPIGYEWNLPLMSAEFGYSLLLALVGFAIVMWIERAGNFRSKK